MNIEAASKYSFNNRRQIESSNLAGCYCYKSIFKANEITEWTAIDDTAICPKCGIDSVLGDSSPYSIDPQTLNKLKDR